MVNHKVRGTVGELAVAQKLMLLGYPVFTELGDNSRVDLIALVDDCPVKIQVKTTTVSDGLVCLHVRKTTVRYSYTYKITDVDIFAVYVEDSGDIFFVSSSEALVHSSVLSFRAKDSNKGNSKNARYLVDYYDILDALSYNKTT